MRIESKTKTSSLNKSIAPHIFQSLIHFFGVIFWRNFVFCSLSPFIWSNVMTTWNSFSLHSKKKEEVRTVNCFPQSTHMCVCGSLYASISEYWIWNGFSGQKNLKKYSNFECQVFYINLYVCEYMNKSGRTRKYIRIVYIKRKILNKIWIMFH